MKGRGPQMLFAASPREGDFFPTKTRQSDGHCGGFVNASRQSDGHCGRCSSQMRRAVADLANCNAFLVEKKGTRADLRKSTFFIISHGVDISRGGRGSLMKERRRDATETVFTVSLLSMLQCRSSGINWRQLTILASFG